MKVQCEITGCGKNFDLMAPDQIIECRTIDNHGTEVGARTLAFVCPRCEEEYAVIEDDKEDWQ